MSDSPYNSLVTSHRKLAKTELALVVCWAVAVTGLGGYAAGLAITKFGTLGTVSLWLVGEAAGFGGRKIVSQKSKFAGVILVGACLGAFVIAEVCWLHWKTIQGEESWLAAIRLLPTFLQEYTLAAIIGGVFCLIGANSAFRCVARRYRIVHVVEE